MQNAGDQVCYANSSFLAMLWSFTSRSTFSLSDWGERAVLFEGLINRSQTQPLSLAHEPWFIALLIAWPENEGVGQSDSAEFTHQLLNWVSAPNLSFAWEKRVLQGGKICIEDRGSPFLPLTIQLEPTLDSDGVIPLSALLRHWHEEWGMSQGLKSPTELLCIHIDRFLMDASGNITKNVTPISVQGGPRIPVFSGDDLTCTWQVYHVLAATAHLGDTRQGHYQTLLAASHAHDTDDPVLWIHFDDNRHGETCWTAPEEFFSQVTLLWLCRDDCLEIHQKAGMASIAETVTAPAPDASSAMLALLAARTGI
eukprot:s1590_g11.t1